MLQFLPIIEGNTIAIRASGKLSHEDYQDFLPKLEAQIKDLGKVSVLFELADFSGWELEAAKDDFKFGMEHLSDFDRIAIVGDQVWEKWMTIIAKPFLPSGTVRYFNRDELQQAWDWLREFEKLKALADEIKPYKKITVAVDYSPSSKHAVKRGLELAKYYNAELTLLNIVEEIIPYPVYYGDSITGYIYDAELLAKQNKAQLDLAKKEMESYVKSLNTDVAIKSEVLSGNIKETILSFIEAQNCDLSIFGTKKKTGIAKLLGSIPRYIQNHARCETLIVPLMDANDVKE